MPVGPLEIGIFLVLVFLVLGTRGIKKMSGRAAKRVGDTANAAIEAKSGAQEEFVKPATGEGPAAKAGAALREGGEAAVEAGKEFRAGVTRRHDTLEAGGGQGARPAVPTAEGEAAPAEPRQDSA